MLSTLLLSALALSADPVQTAPQAPAGQYVEARTAAVFAGACHYGSQLTTQGREAVLGWRIEAGSHAGVDLAHTVVAVLVKADKNLVEPDAKRTSVVYVPNRLAPERERALLGWLRQEHGPRLGKITATRRADVRVKVEGDDFQLRVGEIQHCTPPTFWVNLQGSALAERACCKMPYNVWYEPFVPLQDRLVGMPGTFLVREPNLSLSWSRSQENNVFFGRFGKRAVTPASVAVAQAR